MCVMLRDQFKMQFRGPYTFWNTYALGFQLSAVQLVLLRAIIGTGSSYDSEAVLCSWCSKFGIWNTTPYTQKLFQYLTVPNYVRYSSCYLLQRLLLILAHYPLSLPCFNSKGKCQIDCYLLIVYIIIVIVIYCYLFGYY